MNLKEPGYWDEYSVLNMLLSACRISLHQRAMFAQYDFLTKSGNFLIEDTPYNAFLSPIFSENKWIRLNLAIT
jgi:hypothetical protein